MKTSVILKKPGFLMGIALAILLAVSCEKDPQFVEHEETTVEGLLLSAADRSPIAHGKVLLLSSYRDGSLDAIFYGRSFGIRNVITTDAQGRFSYRFKHSEDTMYNIAAEAEGYFPNRNSGGYPYPNWRATGRGGVKRGYINYYTRADDGPREFINEKGIVYNAEIRLAPEGWIQFHIVNEPPGFESDRLDILTEESSLSKIFTGSSVNRQFIDGPVMAGRYSRILYNVTSQGEFQFYADSIYVEPHDTVLYELEY